jgi:hypothetical protein
MHAAAKAQLFQPAHLLDGAKNLRNYSDFAATQLIDGHEIHSDDRGRSDACCK